ncbi:uncharacterized protein LOC120690666 [Panicum virgatum]|uniref:At1g61320/AtMIF1 LRR domain-containing protein n=1 Tax=Panicum virgatum TaxID=38727 RepID=A0A8T0N0Q6_PANVG|nr:uncharacterized protein LOC120690666 [Panicum virgatum]KAG2543351.1 hypothetical protein PVAP13_9NG740977 [Panicum virgatum]
MLQRLRYLEVIGCDMMQELDIKAPNISTFFYGGCCRQLSLGETLQKENIHMIFSGAVHYAHVELPSSMPNLKIATIRSSGEMANIPMLHSKFLHLKKLSIALSTITFSPAYDYFSLVSFLDACPFLENLILDVRFCSYFCDFSSYHSGTMTILFLFILGIKDRDGACLHFHGSLEPEEDARTLASQGEESEDPRIHVCKEAD